MKPFSQWFRSEDKHPSAKGAEYEGQLAKLEAEAEAAPVGSKGNALNRAGDLCLRFGDRPRALGFYGRAIDAMLSDGHPEPARGTAKKIIRIHPEAVRTLCTLTWLDLASQHSAMALIHLEQYVEAAVAGRRSDLAVDQILKMAGVVTQVEFLGAAAGALETLGAEKDAERVRDWAEAGGSPDAEKDPEELAARCLREAVGSNMARRAEGTPA